MKHETESFEDIYSFRVIDRTGEFKSIVKYADSKNKTSRKNFQRSRHSKPNDFLNVSKKISKDLAQTDVKLESLTLITSQLEKEDNKIAEKDLLGGKRGAVNRDLGGAGEGGMVAVGDLHEFIKQDITVLNKDIEQLEIFVKKQSSCNKHTTQHAIAIVLTLQTRLVSLSSQFKCFLQSNKHLLTKATKISKNIENSSDHRSNRKENVSGNNHQRNTFHPQQQQNIHPHQQQHPQYPIQQDIIQGYNNTQQQKSLQQQPFNNAYNNKYNNYNHKKDDNHPNNVYNSTDQNTNNPTQNTHHQHYNNPNNTDFLTQPTNTSTIPINNQQQMLRQRRGGDEVMRGVDEVGAIEQTIVELGGIFHQLATMVNEQADVVCRIDSHVDESSLNVEAGHGELLKYLRSISGTRSFMIKVFLVLVLFFVLFSYMIR